MRTLTIELDDTRYRQLELLTAFYNHQRHEHYTPEATVCSLISQEIEAIQAALSGERERRARGLLENLSAEHRALLESH
jgi:hypothetical protein